MKKYLIAAAVAVIAFSMAAFAATLNVNGGTVQAGIDTTLACYDDAIVTYDTGYDQTGASTDEKFEVLAVNVEFTGAPLGGCGDSNRAHVKINDGGPIAGPHAPGNASEIGPHGYAIVEIENDNTVSIPVQQTLFVEDVHQVQVMVKDAADSNTPGEFGGYDGGSNSVFGTP